MVEAILELDSEAQATPKSLSGCDSLVMPKILKDFPDFDPSLAKTYVKEYLTDYASEETKAVGDKLIEKEIDTIPKEKVRNVVIENLRAIEEDNRRDFRF